MTLRFKPRYDLTFTEALERWLAASTTFPGTHSPSHIQRWLRRELKRGLIDAHKRKGRWWISSKSLAARIDEWSTKGAGLSSRILWERRARLLLATLLREAMSGEGRPCSWPFDSIESMSDADIDALWKALHAQLDRLEVWPKKSDQAWLRMALKLPPNLKVIQ